MRAMQVLTVVSSAPRYPNGRPTGLWIGELTHFWAALAERGVGMEVASIAGGPVPIDPVSEGLLGGPHAPTRRFLDDPGRRATLERSVALAEVDVARFDAIYFAGGHGAMFDFRGDAAVAGAIAAMHARGGLIAAVCHGVAALVDVPVEGQPLVRGRAVTGFSNLEERLALRWSEVPFKLETALVADGARYSKALMPFAVHVVEDGTLLTGQNPRSAGPLGHAVAARLAGRAAATPSS